MVYQRFFLSLEEPEDEEESEDHQEAGHDDGHESVEEDAVSSSAHADVYRFMWVWVKIRYPN